MKRERDSPSPLVCTRQEWAQRCQAVPLDMPLEMWKVIATFIDTSDLARMNQVCVCFYAALGGPVALCTHALETRNNRVFGAMKSVCLPASDFLPPLRWAMLTGKWGDEATTFQDTFALHYKGGVFPANMILAGGYPRAIMVRMLRTLGVAIPPNLDADYHDLDIFISSEYLKGDNQRQADGFIKLLSGDPSAIFGLNKTCRLQDIPYNTWDKKPVQCIVPAARVEGTKVPCVPYYSIIANFDFTCTQAAVYEDGKLAVTPAFLFSLFTGNMFYTGRDKFDWPIEGLCTDWIQITAISKRPSSPLRWKIRVLTRYHKYVQKGYHDPTLTAYNRERLQSFTEHEDYRFIEENPSYDDWIADMLTFRI